MPIHKITPKQRETLCSLYQSGNIEESKKMALELGLSPYYGAVLTNRANSPRLIKKPKRVASKKWQRAIANGPVLA